MFTVKIMPCLECTHTQKTVIFCDACRVASVKVKVFFFAKQISHKPQLKLCNWIEQLSDFVHILLNLRLIMCFGVWAGNSLRSFSKPKCWEEIWRLQSSWVDSAVMMTCSRPWRERSLCRYPPSKRRWLRVDPKMWLGWINISLICMERKQQVFQVKIRKSVQ